MSNVMTFSHVEKPVPKRFDYEYNPKIKKRYGEIFSQENIGKYSSKIAGICDILRRPSNGIILIYSQYIDGGLIPMALALESMGFSRYASSSEHNRNLFKKSYEAVDSMTMKPRSQMAKTDTFTPAKYVIITGEKDFSQKNDEDVKYVTSKSNADGSMVKVILISMAASEGLDFKNIRQVHILEPWYNMNRIEQIIGRGVRNYSHCDLEFEKRNVEIYLHGTILDRDEESADLYVYRSAEKKALQIGQVTRLLKETAVDCQLNIGQTHFTEAKLLADVANRDIHIQLSSGQRVPFNIGDKPRTDICDYMENCMDTCAVRETFPRNKSTYDEQFVKNNSTMIMKKIKDLFLERHVYSRDHLIGAINLVKKYPIEHIYYALTRFINNKNETITDKYGRIGHLISRGEYYAFQPNEIMDESLSVFERSFPVDYKPVSLEIELPKEIKGVPPTRDVNVRSPTREPDMATAVLARTYSEIMEDITKTIQIVRNPDPPHIKASENNWFKHENKINLLLMEPPYSLNPTEIDRYVIHHYLDVLPLADKLTLVNHVYGNGASLSGKYTGVLKEYYDGLVLTHDEETAIVLANGEVNQMFVQGETGQWSPAQYTEEKAFARVRKERLVVPTYKINPTEIGFMHPFKNKEVVFKTQDMTQKRNNKGAKCVDSSKPAVAKKIATILAHKSIVYADSGLERPQLCVLLEILMRWLTETQMRTYFFGPERTNEMDITNLKL